MADADYTFAQARAKLEDIVSEVRKKDVSLERSLDLLEEGVRLANACTEQIDQSEWRDLAGEGEAMTADADASEAADADSAAGEGEAMAAGADASEAGVAPAFGGSNALEPQSEGTESDSDS